VQTATSETEKSDSVPRTLPLQHITSGCLLIIFKVPVKQFTWLPPHLSTHFGQNLDGSYYTLPY